jgi:SAM-dependent methyltransferase
MASAGQNVHGEADLVEGLGPASVLDAGCGTGRVAIELDRRGIEVVGVDLDPSMLAGARAKAPHLTWVAADLATLDLTSLDLTSLDDTGLDRRRDFDVVLLAGNVMIFLTPGSEPAVVAALARHLRPGGALVAGFQLQPGRLPLAAYDRHCTAAGLLLEHRWATWDKTPFEGGDYAVSVHRHDHPSDHSG